MAYVVNFTSGVNFAPETTAEEILQNIRTILVTRVGTVPLDRDFGLSWEHLDKPYPVARSLMTAAVVEAIEKYESRVTVDSVEFDGDSADAMQGLLRPRVTISIKSEGDNE